MPSNDWDKRFDTVINATAERRAAYDEVASTGADLPIVRLHLKNAWSSETDFTGQHRKRLAVVFTAAEKLLADMKNVTTQLEAFRDVMREGLKEEPNGFAFIEAASPLLPLADALHTSISWVEGSVLPAFATRIPGTPLPKKRRGKQARRKRPILLTTDVHLMILVTYLREIDQDRPHHGAVAHLMAAAAEASRVLVPLRVDGHWVVEREERFQTNQPGYYANVIKGWATKYAQKK